MKTLNSFRASRLAPYVMQPITKWLLLPCALSVYHVSKLALQAASYTLNNNCPCALGRYDRTFHPFSVQIASTAHYLSTYTWHYPTKHITEHKNCLYLTINKNKRYRHTHASTITGGWPGETHTLEFLGSSSRTQTVPIDQRSSKASRRVRTTLIHHATLGIEGVPTLLLSPSAAWDSLYEVLSMVCQGGDASRVHNVPIPLSHLSAFPTLNPRTPCTLERWYARPARERWRHCSSWLRNKYTATIKIHPSAFYLFLCSFSWRCAYAS